MPKTTYTAWKRDELPSGDVDMASLVDDKDGLRILLETFPPSSSRRTLEIHFEFPRAYRVMDEGYRLDQFGNFEPDQRSPIYRVENSPFLDEFHRLSLDTLQTFDLVHYFVVSVNNCVDVLTEVEPTIKCLP
jgi:hypothetical protein